MRTWLICLGVCVSPALAQPPPDPPPAAPGSVKQPVLTRPPEIITFVEAEYPPAALAEKRTGAVGMALTIQLDGSVTDVEVVQSAGHGFDEAAVAAAKQFVWRPAELDGKPGVVRISYRYTFTLQAEEAPVEVPKTPVGRLEGELLERGTRAPLAGIIVQLGTGEEAISDANGLFAFDDVPAGSVIILIKDDIYADVEDEETVEVGKATTVRYYLEREAFEDSIQVVGRRPKKQVVRRTLALQEIRTIPGTQGDALKVIQNMPGAARSVFSDQIVLRGGGQSQAFLNSHAIPLAFHFGGLRSTVSSALIESLDIYPGNYGVEYGRVNGGIVDVRLRRPAIDGFHGYAEVDIFDAGFLIEGPLSEDWSFALAARRSYIDAILVTVLPESVRAVFQTAPRYYDGQLMLEGQMGKHTVRTLLYGSSDLLRIIFDNDTEQNTGASIGQDWVGGQAHWKYRRDDTFENALSVSYTATDIAFGVNPGLAVPLGLDLTQHLVTVRDELKLGFGAHTLRLGTDTTVNHSSVNGRLPQAQGEGEPDRDGPPSTLEENLFDFTESVTRVNPALYAAFEAKFGALTLIPGVRADWFGGADQLWVQPRLSARWKVHPNTVLKGGVGLFGEPPQPQEVIDGYGTPDLEIETSLQYSLGFEQTLAEGLTLDVVGYYKQLDQLITRGETGDPIYANQGIGRAYGMEVLLRQSLTSRLYGWVAYTLSRSERQDRSGEPWRLFDLDQTHNLTVVAQYKFTPTWEAGLRWRYVTGNPTTPVRGADLDGDTGDYVPIFGAVNSGRLGTFHQLDLRVDKHWVFDTWRLTTYLDVQNVYNRANPEGIEFQYDYAAQATQAGLPIVPSFGVRGSF